MIIHMPLISAAQCPSSDVPHVTIGPSDELEMYCQSLDPMVDFVGNRSGCFPLKKNYCSALERARTITQTSLYSAYISLPFQKDVLLLRTS